MRALVLIATISLAGPAVAEQSQSFDVFGASVQEAANGVLGILSFNAVPDTSAGSIQLDSATSDNPSVNLIQFGGAFTVADSFPLYMEGFLGYARYDPQFIATEGEQERTIPLKWNNFAATGGLGWDFSLTDELVLRPIFNVTLGHVTSDLAGLETLINITEDTELNFFDEGRLNAYGLGGSLMLDFERVREAYEFDTELRYTHLHLQSFGGTSSAVEGNAEAITINLWSRLRWPTGIEVFERPLRYVVQGSYSVYRGDQAGALGFDRLTKLGGGLEVDLSKWDIGALGLYVRRTRLLASGVFGDNVSGYSIGLGVGF
ncbi:MAG: hypothetical protein ACFB3T_06415 [Geminicoccaceae bacterium]